MVSSASPAGTGFGNEKVACSFAASSVTTARCCLPPALIDTSPKVISAALSTIVDVAAETRSLMVSRPLNFASARRGDTVMS